MALQLALTQYVYLRMTDRHSNTETKYDDTSISFVIVTFCSLTAITNFRTSLFFTNFNKHKIQNTTTTKNIKKKLKGCF